VEAFWVCARPEAGARRAEEASLRATVCMRGGRRRWWRSGRRDVSWLARDDLAFSPANALPARPAGVRRVLHAPLRLQLLTFRTGRHAPQIHKTTSLNQRASQRARVIVVARGGAEILVERCANTLEGIP
jgi:hypothetical protein